MQHVRRAVVLGLSLLSACAAAGPPSSRPTEAVGPISTTSVTGAYLAGRFAVAQSDPALAASEFLYALAKRPNDIDLRQEAFIACLMAGRPEADQLARSMPDNQAAQLLLGDEEAVAGHWTAADKRFQSLSRQGLMQMLQPILVAWTQQGAGRTDDALATLRPGTESEHPGLAALHAALIADLGNRPAEADRLYHLAQANLPTPTLRLAQLLASWQARQGHLGEAEHTLATAAQGAPEAGIALPRLVAALPGRPVARPRDGVAEAYLALASALHDQDANGFAIILLRLALTLRPDFTPARLLAAEVLESDRHLVAAEQMLAAVPAKDPLAPVVQLRQARLAERDGRTDQALHTLQALALAYPDSPLPDLQAGDVLRAKQRFPEAIAAYDRAIARISAPGPDDWPAFYVRGIAYERSHQWQKAEADFRHALELSPDQPLILNYLGYSWADMGQHLSQAREMLQKAADRRPDDGAIADSLGWVMFRQGEVADAVKVLEHAVELQPEDATVNSHLGDVYWAAGRKLEATYQWRRALALNPEPDDAAKLAARLQSGRPTTVVGSP